MAQPEPCRGPAAVGQGEVGRLAVFSFRFLVIG